MILLDGKVDLLDKFFYDIINASNVLAKLVLAKFRNLQKHTAEVVGEV